MVKSCVPSQNRYKFDHDEPVVTTDTEKRALFDLTASLKDQGVSIIMYPTFLMSDGDLRSRYRHEGRQRSASYP